MKKILLLLTIALVFSCSKDDDGTEAPLTNKEKLIQGGTWNYQSVELLEIIEENTDVTESELQEFLNQNFSFVYSYNFNENNVTIKIDDATIVRGYTISNDTGQNNFTMNIADYSTFTNCSVNSTSFVYEEIYYAFMPWGEEIACLVRFKFN